MHTFKEQTFDSSCGQMGEVVISGRKYSIFHLDLSNYSIFEKAHRKSLERGGKQLEDNCLPPVASCSLPPTSLSVKETDWLWHPLKVLGRMGGKNALARWMTKISELKSKPIWLPCKVNIS